MKDILYFTAPWCRPCQSFGPVIDKVAQNGIRVTKINVDVSRELAEEYHVKSVPTLIYRKHGKELYRNSGLETYEAIVNTVKTL